MSIARNGKIGARATLIRHVEGFMVLTDDHQQQGMRMLRHSAMFRFKEGATDEQKRAARDALANLRDKVPTVRSLTVGFDIRRNPRNWDMLLVVDFDDKAGLEAYFANPIMQAASDLVASVTQKEITARVQILY
jgi:quinol monooxygenase YgiN